MDMVQFLRTNIRIKDAVMGRRNALGCGKNINYGALLSELKSDKANERENDIIGKVTFM